MAMKYRNMNLSKSYSISENEKKQYNERSLHVEHDKFDPKEQLSHFLQNYLTSFTNTVSQFYTKLYYYYTLVTDIVIILSTYQTGNCIITEKRIPEKLIQKTYTGDTEILGWCPAGPVLPYGEKVPLQHWLATLLVLVSR